MTIRETVYRHICDICHDKRSTQCEYEPDYPTGWVAGIDFYGNHPLLCIGCAQLKRPDWWPGDWITEPVT